MCDMHKATPARVDQSWHQVASETWCQRRGVRDTGSSDLLRGTLPETPALTPPALRLHAPPEAVPGAGRHGPEELRVLAHTEDLRDLLAAGANEEEGLGPRRRRSQRSPHLRTSRSTGAQARAVAEVSACLQPRSIAHCGIVEGINSQPTHAQCPPPSDAYGRSRQQGVEDILDYWRPEHTSRISWKSLVQVEEMEKEERRRSNPESDSQLSRSLALSHSRSLGVGLGLGLAGDRALEGRVGSKGIAQRSRQKLSG